MLKEELKYIPQTEKDIKKFGITLGIFLVIVSFLLWYFDYSGFIYFASTGCLLLFLRFIYFKALKPVYKVWMTFALILGWFMTRVILTIVFYFVVTPISLTARLFRKKFLQLSYKEEKESYWQIRIKQEFSKDEYERQF